MSATVQAHAHNGISCLQHRHKYRHIGLCAGMWLYIGIITAKQLLRPLNGNGLYHVDVLTAAIVALPGISFCVLIGQYRSHGHHHWF